jgi:hypothetical protein
MWIGEPSIEEDLVTTHNVSPHTCRLRDITYRYSEVSGSKFKFQSEVQVHLKFQKISETLSLKVSNFKVSDFQVSDFEGSKAKFQIPQFHIFQISKFLWTSEALKFEFKI